MDSLHVPTRTSGLLVILSGPSGVGKDALLGRLAELGNDLHKCVTATTRPPRLGETEGISYLFYSDAEFCRKIEAGEFLEYAEVHGYLYGTPKQAVVNSMASGRDVALNIDVQGGASAKRVFPDAVLVYVAPPSSSELARRLRSRGTDSDEAVQLRLDNAKAEAEAASQHYTYQIVNDDLLQASKRLEAILVAERCRIVRTRD
jgi:guanylate kinase